METHVKVLAILQLIFAALSILLAATIFIATGVVSGIVGTAAEPGDAMIAIPLIRLSGVALGFFFLALAIPGAVMGLGLLARRPWARILGIALSIVELTHVPVGTALGIYGLWVLLNRETERLF